jgi:hypothetical protein
MTALLGMLALAGYQNRDKIIEMFNCEDDDAALVLARLLADDPRGLRRVATISATRCESISSASMKQGKSTGFARTNY